VIERLNRKRGEEGFTLIELLIVIVILGILAAIVVFAVGTTGANAAIEACKADAKSVEVALEAYKAQNLGSYPAGPTSPTDVSNSSAGWGALLGVGTGTGAPFLRAEPSTSHYLLWWTVGTNNTTAPLYIGASGTAYPAGTASNDFDATDGVACNTYAK